MRRVFCVCLCVSSFVGSTTQIWATDLALPPLRPPSTSVFAYRWSGCHAGANVGYGWSRQQETWAQSGGVAAPSQPAATTMPVAAAPQQTAQPPANNPNGNNGGSTQPYKHHHVHGHHGDHDWWQPGKQHHYDRDADHRWSRYGQHHIDQQHWYDHDAGHIWPRPDSKDGYTKHADHDWLWLGQQHGGSSWPQMRQYDDNDKSGGHGWSQPHANGAYDRTAWLQHDRPDAHEGHAGWGWPDSDKSGGHGWSPPRAYSEYEKYAWLPHEQKYDHGDHVWQPSHPHKPDWPHNNPPPKDGGGQPQQQNPPPAAVNNGGGAVAPQGGTVAPQNALLLQMPMTISSNGDDVIGGVQLGCDYQMDRFVVGIQAMADFAKFSAFGPVPQAPQLTTNTTARNLYTATVRAGYLVTPSILAYLKGGAAWTRTSVALLDNATGQSATVAFNRSGWTVGAGVEWMFDRHWSAFAEYDYADFGSVTGSLPGSAALTGGPTVVNQKSQLHTVLVGVNYKFDLLALAGR